MQRSSHRDGGALLLVLILLGLAAGLILQVQLAARQRLQTARASLTRSALLRAAADATVAALQRLADDEDLLVDSTNEAWTVTEDLTNPDGVGTLVRIRDENRLFDINNLAVAAAPGARTPSDILLDILAMCGNYQSSALVDAMKDWMDDDDSGYHESDVYLKKTPPYQTPNRILYSWNELLPAQGVQPELFQRRDRVGPPRGFDADFIDCITLIPIPRARPAPININSAPEPVLTGVLGVQFQNVARTVIGRRNIQPYRSLEQLQFMMTPEQFARVQPYLDVRSSIFSVETRAFLDGHVAQLRVVARRGTDGRVEILQWIL